MGEKPNRHAFPSGQSSHPEPPAKNGIPGTTLTAGVAAQLTECQSPSPTKPGWRFTDLNRPNLSPIAIVSRHRIRSQRKSIGPGSKSTHESLDLGSEERTVVGYKQEHATRLTLHPLRVDRPGGFRNFLLHMESFYSSHQTPRGGRCSATSLPRNGSRRNNSRPRMVKKLERTPLPRICRADGRLRAGRCLGKFSSMNWKRMLDHRPARPRTRRHRGHCRRHQQHRPAAALRDWA